MLSNSHATITYTSMSSYEVIVNGYFRMPMDPLDPYAQLVMKVPPSPDYIPRPEAPPSPDYIPGLEYLPPADDVFPAKEQPLPTTISPTTESPGYIMDSEPEMDPEEEDRDDEKSEGDSIDYSTSIGDDDADDDGDDLSKVERLLAIPTPPLSLVSPTSYPLPPFLMPLPIFTPLPPPPPIILPCTRASMVLMRSTAPSTSILAPLSRTPPIGTPPLLPIPLPTSSLPLPLLLPFTSCREGIPEADMPLQKRAHFTTPTGEYEKMAPKRARTTRANLDPTRTTTATEPMTQEAINNLIAQRVTKALAEYKTQRNSIVNRDTSHTTGRGPRIVRLTRDINNCTAENQVKFASCTLIGSALTWWNSHMRAVSQEVKGTDIASYTLRFQELALLCGRMFLEESDVIERYVGGLAEMIQGNVMSYKPKSMKKAIEFANDQMDQKLLGISDRQADNKRKFDNTSRNQQNQQPFKRNNNVARAYAAWSGEKKPYGGTKPLCPKCNFYHDGPCGLKCTNCKRTGHIARDYRSRVANTNNNNNNNNCNNRRATAAYQGVLTCFECAAQGGNPDANVMTGTFLLNNRCASILFDTGADKSFVSTAFSSLININPSILDYSYDVELADGQIIRVNTVIRGCTLNFLNHPFNIDLMPIELGSFDVIIGMNWLKTYHALIVCNEKIVRVPFGNETLIIRCNGSNNGTQLNIISCTKTRKYLIKGYPVFLVNITTKTIKDKSEEKRLENVPIVRDFSEVFLEDLPGLPPT
nr:hypothetical protein [Tanacetum cinerariifolium]